MKLIAQHLYPEWGRTRLYNMIRDRGDWVISRQRMGCATLQSSTLKMVQLS